MLVHRDLLLYVLAKGIIYACAIGVVDTLLLNLAIFAIHPISEHVKAASEFDSVLVYGCLVL